MRNTRNQSPMKKKPPEVLGQKYPFSKKNNTEAIITFLENHASRVSCELGNWRLSLFPAEDVRECERLTRVRLNWLGTVLDSPDYSYRAAMPRARASFPHPFDDPVLTPPLPLLLLFLFRWIRTHTYEWRIRDLRAVNMRMRCTKEISAYWKLSNFRRSLPRKN